MIQVSVWKAVSPNRSISLYINSALPSQPSTRSCNAQGLPSHATKQGLGPSWLSAATPEDIVPTLALSMDWRSFFSLTWEGAVPPTVSLSPHCPQGFFAAMSGLFTIQKYFGVQRKVQYTVSEAVWIHCKNKCLPQAASSINRLKKKCWREKRRHNFTNWQTYYYKMISCLPDQKCLSRVSTVPNACPQLIL